MGRSVANETAAWRTEISYDSVPCERDAIPRGRAPAMEHIDGLGDTEQMANKV